MIKVDCKMIYSLLELRSSINVSGVNAFYLMILIAQPQMDMKTFMLDA